MPNQKDPIVIVAAAEDIFAKEEAKPEAKQVETPQPEKHCGSRYIPEER